MTSKTYTDRSNARRAGKKAGIPPEAVGTKETWDGKFEFFDMREVNTDRPLTDEEREPHLERMREEAEEEAAEVAKAEKIAADNKAVTALAGTRMRAKTKEAIEAAQEGIMPTPPDFTAPSHKPWRKHLAAIVELAKAGDVDRLRAYPIEPKSSSRKAICRYRDLAITALESRQ